MGQIYQHAYLTISAVGCKDSYSGCFPARHEDSYVSPGMRSLGYDTRRECSGQKSEIVDYEHTSRPGQRNRLHFFDEWLPGSLMPLPQPMTIGCFGKRFDPLEDQPLTTRGWTLQERLLSPRTVHYATDQMYFECEQSLCSEDGFDFTDLYFSLENLNTTQHCAFEQHGMFKDAGVSFIRGTHAATQQPGLQWQGGWLFLVENYSQRRLTVSLDKLSALAGVARVVADHTGDRYFAGVWASHIHEDLMWLVYTHEERFDGKKPIRGRMLGRAAPIYKIEPYEPTNPWEYHGLPVKIDLGDERGVCAGSVHLDYPDEPLPSPCYALFLDPAYAIILKAKDSEPVRDADGCEDLSRLVPKPLLTSGDINRTYCSNQNGDSNDDNYDDEDPTGEGETVWLRGDETSADLEARKPQQDVNGLQSAARGSARRDGGIFLVAAGDAARGGASARPVKHDLKTQEVLKQEDMEHVKGDQAEGSISGEDLEDWVTLRVRREDLVKHGNGDQARRPVAGEDSEGWATMRVRAKDIERVGGDQSWGPVTSEDPKVWVTIF
ncbi:hypothetical protein MMYC01_208653 [Madurella mycetomatis]|uniref:Heterokaryon incompatibility domain-containing protein n=1 Tax=Madurella mycetomatis TaxID=100816 RepID=A0A175VU26_9PEZI|nr:hypothetical protein MMYC01_208653 [Madurella mycetomatis]